MTEEDPPSEPKNENQGNNQAEYIAAITDQIGAPLKDLAVEFASFKRDLSSQLAALKDQVKAENEEEKSNRNAREQNQLYWTRFSAISTIVLSVFTLLVLGAALYVAIQQMVITGGQLTVMDSQLIEMKSSSGDTRVLADSASKQAENTEKLALTAAEQSKATQLSADQAKRAADIGEASLHSINESARRDQRAWVGPHTAIHRDFAVGSKATVGYTIVNSGKTPALDFRTSLAARYLRKGAKFVAEYPTGSEAESIGTLQPGGRIELKTTSPATNFTEVDIEALKRGEIILYFYIEVKYRDIFNEPHSTRACSFMSQDLLAANVCDTYNDAN